LIEMLISVFILSITVAFVTVMAGTIAVSRDSAFVHNAFRIADNKLDELRAGGYAALPASGPFNDPGLADLPQGSASTTITVWNAQTKKVTADVSWQSADGAQRAVSLTTLITESGGL